MRLIKVLLLAILLNFSLLADEKVNINFNDLKIMELVKITSKILDKNILVTNNIKGKVEFISNRPLYKSELLKVLNFTLESKGYTIVDNKDILRIVKLNESAKSNVPVVSNRTDKKVYTMATEIFPVYNANADYIASKIRHLLSRNGKLVTNKESNVLVITDFKDNIDTVKKIISNMTKGAKKNTSEVYLKNIKASEAKKNLDLLAKSMFNSQIVNERVAIIQNKESNSIVLVGNRKNIAYLKKYITKIDKDDSLVKREVKVIPLKNVESKNVIKILESVVGKKRYIDVNDKPLLSVDEESNAIVIMGPSDELEYIYKLVAQLDKEKAQVYVQARIIEVNDDLVDEIGVSYGILAGRAGSNGLAAFSSKLNGGSSAITDITTIGLQIPNITSGLALGASLNLLRQNGALDVVSEPSILAINNKESSIYVGETISVKTSSTTTDGGNTNDNYKREDVGLTLKVKPRISNDNKVTLEINTTLENVKTTKTTSGNPDTQKKEIKTSAILNNGESVIIGGLIENRSENTKTKVPLLGDIPLFGELFKNKVLNTKKNNLVVIVTPYLIPKTKDITFIRNKLSQLKALEDKFLADALIRLKKQALKRRIDDRKREQEVARLETKLKKLDNIYKKPKKNHTQRVKSHKQRVSEILGN